MPTLRLTQHVEKEDRYRVEIAFEDDDGSRLTADPKFQFELTSTDRADLRNFEPYGQGAAQDVEKTQRLIAEIEQAMKSK
jgi:hypothetical protein